MSVAGVSEVTIVVSTPPKSPDPKKTGMSTGAIAGISVGSVAGVLLIALVVHRVVRRRTGSKDNTVSVKEKSFTEQLKRHEKVEYVLAKHDGSGL